MITTKYLGLEINHLNWKNPIDQMITKLSGAFYAVRLMFHVALLNMESIYFANFNGLYNSEKMFALHTKIIKSFGVCSPWNFIVNDQETESSGHSINTWNKHELKRPNANLPCFLEIAFYTGMKIFNNLPFSLKPFRNEFCRIQSNINTLPVLCS
jgi:hypothetical protein